MRSLNKLKNVLRFWENKERGLQSLPTSLIPAPASPERVFSLVHESARQIFRTFYCTPGRPVYD